MKIVFELYLLLLLQSFELSRTINVKENIDILKGLIDPNNENYRICAMAFINEEFVMSFTPYYLYRSKQTDFIIEKHCIFHVELDPLRLIDMSIVEDIKVEYSNFKKDYPCSIFMKFNHKDYDYKTLHVIAIKFPSDVFDLYSIGKLKKVGTVNNETMHYGCLRNYKDFRNEDWLSFVTYTGNTDYYWVAMYEFADVRFRHVDNISKKKIVPTNKYFIFNYLGIDQFTFSIYYGHYFFAFYRKNDKNFEIRTLKDPLKDGCKETIVKNVCLYRMVEFYQTDLGLWGRAYTTNITLSSAQVFTVNEIIDVEQTVVTEDIDEYTGKMFTNPKLVAYSEQDHRLPLIIMLLLFIAIIFLIFLFIRNKIKRKNKKAKNKELEDENQNGMLTIIGSFPQERSRASNTGRSRTGSKEPFDISKALNNYLSTNSKASSTKNVFPFSGNNNNTNKYSKHHFNTSKASRVPIYDDSYDNYSSNPNKYYAASRS